MHRIQQVRVQCVLLTMSIKTKARSTTERCRCSISSIASRCSKSQAQRSIRTCYKERRIRFSTYSSRRLSKVRMMNELHPISKILRAYYSSQNHPPKNNTASVVKPMNEDHKFKKFKKSTRYIYIYTNPFVKHQIYSNRFNFAGQ